MTDKREEQQGPIKQMRIPFIIALAVLILLIASVIYNVGFNNILTDPPSATPVRVVAWAGAEIGPEDFVSDVTGENVTVRFSHFSPPPSMHGVTGAEIELSDEYGNVTFVSSQLSMYKLKDKVTAVLGDDISTLCALNFIDGEIQLEDAELFTMLTDVSTISTDTVGTYDIMILLNGVAPPVPAILDVVDVNPPQGRFVRLERWTVDEIEPADFVTELSDETEVTLSFVNEPDRTIEGVQAVQVLLTDESGNEEIVTSVLWQKRDTEPPVIEGELDKAVCIGEAILYREGISVTDNRDEDVALIIDSSAVDPRTEGTYPVIYSATDESGNTSTAEGTLTVYDVSIEAVEEMAAEVLGRIINDNMTQYEKAQAIYRFVRSRISYGSGRIYDNVHYGAYRALRTGSGDCYSYYALSEVLLTAAGIENMPIQRRPGYPTRHFWNLVNFGEGWYHYDALQIRNRPTIFTDSEAARITALPQFAGRGYYDYDETLYPEIVP